MTEYSVSFPDIPNEKEMIQWVINNCPSFVYKTGKFRRGGDERALTETFYFLDEKDAMWFRLNWQ